MFTGIVEELGEVTKRDSNRVTFASTTVLEDAAIGSSISVDGCCLTVVAMGSNWWQADLSKETLLRTTLDDFRPGVKINLERPVRLNDRLGGHLVQGHVDATGEVLVAGANMRIGMPQHLLRYVVEKGSITIDGVSLTVVNLYDDGFDVALIPHTLEVTNLGAKNRGDRVNLEADIMAKYAERLIHFS